MSQKGSKWVVMAAVVGAGVGFCTNASANYCTENSVATLTSAAFTSHWDAYDGLTCLEEHFIAAGDRRAIFASVYTLTTLRMAESIDAGDYQDTEWMEDYQTIFANYYRKAVYDYEVGNNAQVPQSWKLAFDAAASGQTLIIQDVLLGMNAHINRDLPYAVEAVGIGPNTLTKYQDHTLVNDTLGEVADEILATMTAIYGANYQQISAALGPADDLLLATGFTVTRQNAWNNAVALTNSRWWNRWVTTGWIESSANSAGAAALSLNLSPTLMTTLRALEGSNPGSTFCQHFPCSTTGGY
jgi:hypothetical protein